MMMEFLNQFLVEMDRYLSFLPRDDKVLASMVLLLVGFVFWRGGNNMVTRGRGGEMSQQGSAAVVLGALSFVGASALVVNAATGWPAKRCIITGIGLIISLLIGHYTGSFKRLASPLTARMSKKEGDPLPPANMKTWRDFIRLTNPAQFEQFTGWMFKQTGFAVQVTGQPGDGGLDLIVQRDGIRQGVQCKRYTDKAVSVGEVRDFYGAMVGSGLDHGYVVTTSKFTQDAQTFVKKKTGNNILLIDKSDLMPWVERWLDRPIQIECSYCGAANRPEAKFCSSCGAPLG